MRSELQTGPPQLGTKVTQGGADMRNLIDQPEFWIGIFAGAVIIYLAIVLARLVVAFMLRLRARRAEDQAPRAVLEKWGFRPRAEDQAALKIVREHRNRLVKTPHPDPDWIGPLFREVKAMVLRIAKHYYPDELQPLLAPRSSEMARAIQLAAIDLNELLTQHWIVKFLDVRVSRLDQLRRIMDDKYFRKAEIIWRYVKYGLRGWRYASPWMWGTLMAKNAAVRILHATAINALGARAIALYSGRLASSERDLRN